MKKNTRLLALLLSAGLTISAASLTICADDAAAETPIIDECFDDYDDNFDAKSTTLFPTFTIDANSIGEGYVKVLENPDTGNLHLKSHVFTQVYTAEPVKGAYTFSMDVFQTQGNRECAIFLRAPVCGTAAYYEHDGTPGTENEKNACRTGIVINSHHTSIDVNIKSYGARAVDTAHLVQNIFTFDLPEGVTLGQQEYTNFKVVDTGTEMSIYVADGLICRIVFSEPGSGYTRADISENCLRKAVLYDAAGTEMATIDSPLVQSGGATLGWATRVADMIVDNVYLAPYTGEGNTDETTEETAGETAPESETASETVTADETNAETAAESTADTKGETSAETQAPADDSGCGASMAAAGLVSLVGAAFVALKRKH